MGRYYRQPETDKKHVVHPIWRGIGCLLILIIPIVSFAGSVILVGEGIPQQYVPMSRDLASLVNVPGFGPVPLLYTLVVTAVISVLGFVIMTVIYSMVYGMTGKSRYGPLDADPREFKSRKTKKSR